MAQIQEAELIWKDGKLIPWAEATTHVLTHSLHYGNAVFEGVRAYKTDKGYAIFRLDEHTRRLEISAKLCLIKLPFSFEQLRQAQIDVVAKNRFDQTVYLRPQNFIVDEAGAIFDDGKSQGKRELFQLADGKF